MARNGLQKDIELGANMRTIAMFVLIVTFTDEKIPNYLSGMKYFREDHCEFMRQQIESRIGNIVAFSKCYPIQVYTE